MLGLDFARDDRTPLKVLVLGSHSDDIEIGTGGTLLTLLGGEQQLDIKWVVFSAIGFSHRTCIFLLKAARHASWCRCAGGFDI